MAGWREILKEREKQNTSSSVSSTPSSGGGSTFKPSTFNVKTATPDEWGQALQHITSKLGTTKSSTPVTSTPSFAQQYKTVLDNTANVLTKGASGKYTSAEDYSKLSSQIAGLQLMTFADEQENKGKGTQESEAYYRGLREYLAGVQNETVKQKDYYGSFKDEDEYKSTIFADRTPRIEPSKQFTELTIKNPNIEKELTKGGNALIGGGSPLSQMYTAQYTQQLGTLKEYKTDDGYKTIAPRSMPTADDKRDIGASFDLLGADGTIKKNPYVVDKELEQDIWKAQNPYLEFLKQKNVNKTLGLYPLMPAGTPDSSKYLAERQLALIDDEIGKLTELDASKEGSLQKAKADLYNHHTYATTMDKDAFDTKAAVLQSRIGRLDDRLKLLEADKYRLEQEIQGYDMEIKQRSLGKKYAQYSQMSDFDELSKYAGYYDNNYKFTVTPKRLTDSSNADAQLQSIAQDLRNREGDSTLLDALDFIKQYEAKQKNVNILSEKDINNLLFMRAEAEVNGHKQQVDEINKKLGDYQYRQLPQGYIPELVSAPLVIYNPSSQAKREAEEADERDKYEAALRLVKEFREAINGDITGTPEQKNQYKILNTYWQTGEYIDPTQQHYSQGGSKDSDIVRRYGEMTPDEQAIYNYLYNTDGAQAAQKYLDDYADILGMRGAVKVAQEAAEKAEQYPVLSGVAGGLYKLSLANEIMSLIEMGNQAVHGMNPYSPVYDSKIKYDTFNSAAAQRMDELLTDKDGNTLMIPYLNKPVGSTLYNVALSVGDSAGRIPLARLFGSTTVPLLLGSSNAAGATMYEAQLRGLDEAQATMLGIAAGVIEFWTEKHSIDTFFDEKGGFWKSLAQQMLAEGSEEGVSYLGNALADAVIAADKSEVAAMQKQMLIENPNLTPSEARRKAREAFVKDGLAEVLAGALSGAVFGTVAGARNVSYERAAGRYMQEATKGNVNTVVEFAKTRMPKGSESQIEAEKISKRGTPGMRKVGKLANMIMTDLDTVMQQEAQTGKDLGSADLLTAWTDIISDTKNAVKNTAEDFLKPTETTIQEVVDKKEMTAQEAKQMRTGYEKAKEHISEADYTDSYTRAYNAGYYGVAENYLNVSEKIGKITNDIAKAAYEAGRQAYAKLAPALKEKAAQERASKLKPGEGRLLLDEGLSKEQLNDEQREQVDIWSNFAKVLGVEAVMFKSDLEQDGIEKVYNGMYDYDSGRIYIDINAGKLKVDDLKRTIVLRTAGHELTHFIKRFSPELFRAYAKAVTDVLIAKGQNIDTLVNNEVARYKSQGIDADMGVALEEVIANASEMMLQDSQAVQKMAEESPTLLQKIADWFKDFAKRVKEAFNRINIVERPETRALMHEVEGGLKYIDGLQEMFDNALIHASGFYDNLTEADTTISKAVKGTEVAPAVELDTVAKGETRFSLRDYEAATDEKLVEFYNYQLNNLRNNKGYKIVSKMNANLASKVNELLGLDVRDYEIAINASDMNHIIRRHGPQGEHDHSMADPKDFARISYIINNFDSANLIYNEDGSIRTSIGHRDKYGNPSPLVLLNKQIDLRNYYASQAVADTSRKIIWITSAYIENIKTEGLQVPNEYNSLSGTPETRAAMPSDNINISHAGTKSQGQIQTDFDIDDTDSGTSLYQARFTGTTSAREVLAGAFEDIAVNDTERAMIQKYQKQAEQLDNMEQAILDIRDEISDIEQSPNYDPNEYNDRLIRLRNNAKTLENQIQREDKRLLDMENAAALKAVVKRELAKNKDSWEQKRVKAVEHARAVADRRMERYKGTRARNKYKERIVRNAADLHKWIVNPDGKNKKYVPEVLQGVVAPFLASINETSKRALNGGELTIKDRQFLDRLSTLQRKLGDIAHYQSGAEAIKGEYEALTGYIDLPYGFSDTLGDLVDSVQKLVDDSANANGEFVLNRMSEAELKALDKTIRALRSGITKMNTFLSNAAFEHVDEAANSTMQELDLVKRSASKNQHFEKMNKFLSWDNALPIYVFERLGEGGKSIFQSLQKGMDKLAHNSAQVVEFAEYTFTEKESRAWGKEIHTVEIDGELVDMTTAHIMSLYLHNKRDQSRGHLYGGGMRVGTFKAGGRNHTDDGHLLTESKVQEITDLLTPRQKQVADALQAYMSNVGGDWGNQVSMARFGVEQFGEEYYIPIKSEPAHTGAKTDKVEGNELYKLLNMSMTKRLTPNANNRIVIDNVFDVFAAHMADMATYNALGLPVLDAVKWINHKNVTKYKSGQKLTESVQDSLRNAYGDQAVGYIINFLRDVNGAQNIGERGYGTTMIGRFASAAVGANLRVAFLQPVAIARAIDILDARSVMVGVLRNIPKLRKNIAEMETYSGIAIWKQMGFYDVNLSRSLKQMIKRDDSFGEKLSEKSLALAALGDRVTWAAIWAGAKHEVNRSGKYKYESPEFYDAVNAKFTEVIYKTQVVDTMLTRSDYMRNTGPLHKWTALFKSEPTATYNMVASRVWQMQDDIAKGMSVGEAWNKNAQSIAQGFRTFALHVLLTTLVEQIAGALRDDDDYLTFADKLKEDLLNTTLDNINVLGNLPILDVFYQYGKRIYGKLTDNENIWGYETNNIMFDFLQDIEKVVDIAVSYIKTGKGKYGATEYGLIYKAFEFASKASGYPAASAMREVGVLWNNTVGQLYPEYKLKRYADRADKGYSKLVEAIITADEQGEQRLRKLFDDKGVSEKDFYSGIRKELKALLENGDITEQQAINMLEDELSNFDEYKPQNKPYWEVQKWQFEPEGEESFSEYNRFIEAAHTGKELKEAARELLDHGTTAKDIAAQITREFKPQLLELYNAGDMGGFANMQARALTAYEVIGLNRAEQKKNIDGWVKADVLDRYKEGKLSDTQAMAYIKKNVDTSKKQSLKDLPYWQLKAWQEYRAGKIDSISNYSVYNDFIDSITIGGAVMEKKAKELLDNGATKANIGAQITSKYKPIYLELYRAGKHAELDRLTEQLLDAYVAAGYKRYEKKKDVRAWRKAKDE